MFENNSRYHLNIFQARPYGLCNKVLPEMSETLGQLIQRRMNDVGISSKSELARKIGKSNAYVGDLINDTGKTKSGTYQPSPEMVGKLSEVLKVSEAEILKTVGYNIDTENALPKPKNFPELVAALESLGIVQPMMFGGDQVFDSFTEDDYEEFLEKTVSELQFMVKRKTRGSNK